MTGDGGDLIFDRESTAFKLIRGRIQDFLSEGYEMRMFETPNVDIFEIMFVGPAAKASDKSHVETLRVSYQLLAFLMYDDPHAMRRWQELLFMKKDTDAALYHFIYDMMRKKLGGENEDGGENGEGKEKQN